MRDKCANSHFGLQGNEKLNQSLSNTCPVDFGFTQISWIHTQRVSFVAPKFPSVRGSFAGLKLPRDMHDTMAKILFICDNETQILSRSLY